MISLVDIPFTLDLQQLATRMRIKDGSDHAKEFESMVNRVQEIGRPKALYKESYVEDKTRDSVVIDSVCFNSLALRKNLDTVERVFPCIATCGNELDEIQVDPGNLYGKSWLAFLKTSLLMVAMQYLQEHIMVHYKIPKLGYMNPGSGDVDVWPIEQQKELLSLFDDIEQSIGVKITKSFILIPDMSVSGILFPTEVDFQSCQLCHRENCIGRRAPFDQKLWDSINKDDKTD